MNSTIPLLSIGLPVYNSSDYLKDVINSLLNQSFTDFELIISDDASKDETTNICKSFSQSDDRIRFISQETNIGMVNNQNYVLKQARGKYFMWAAHDDYYHQEFIQTLINKLDINIKLVTVFSPFAIFKDTPDDAFSICKLNYSGRSAFWRIFSLCLNFNDAIFYGIHRREVLAKTKVPTWRGKNSVTPANSNYPVVFYLLASGSYELVGNDVLFYKRKKEATYALSPSSIGFNPYWYLILRKINLCIDSITCIYSGSHSVILTISLTPPVFIRILKDTIIDVYYRLKCNVLKRKM